jgi:hypothetical protein
MTKRKVKKVVLITLNVLIIVGLGFTSTFYFIKYRNEKNNNLSTEQRIEKYEKEISKSYTLPSGDKATLADVKSADELKKDEANKDFFKDVANGDILLIYTNSKLGILYRPTTKKIIKTGPLAFKQQLTAFIVGAKADREAVIATLKKAFANDISTATEADAKTPITGTTIVVDVTGKNSDLAKRLATELKGVVGNAPEGQESATEGTGIAIYAAPPTPGL